MKIQHVKKPTLWGLDRIDQPLLPLDGKYHYNATGKNYSTNLSTDVVIIDSGIYDYPDEFDNRVNYLFDYRTTLSPDDPDYISPSHPSFGKDDYGSGTFYASIIGSKTYGVAKECSIFAAKIFSRNIETFKKQYLIDALSSILSWHITKTTGHPTVVFLPIVFDRNFDRDIDFYIQQLNSYGITIICPAGNYGKNVEECYPANSPYTLDVGGTTQSDYIWLEYTPLTFHESLSGNIRSNYGNITLYAPGNFIEGLWIPSFENETVKNRTRILSGTDVAASFAAGYAALFFAENPSATFNDFINHIIENSTENVIKGIDYGHRNLLLFNNFQDAIIQTESSGIIATIEEEEEVEIPLLSRLKIGSSPDVKVRFSEASANALFPDLYLTEDGIIRGKTIDINPTLIGYVKLSSPSFHVGYYDHYFKIIVSSYSFKEEKILGLRILDKNEPPVINYTDTNLSLLVTSVTAIPVSTAINYNLNNSSFVIDNEPSSLSFSVLYGELPNGIVLSSNGILKGTIGNFPISASSWTVLSSVEKTYTFALRVTDGYFYTDKEYQMIVLRTSSHNNPPFFADPQYPDLLFTVVKGQSVVYNLTINDSDGDNILVREVSATASGITFSADVFYGLPSSLSVTTDGKIIGNINVDTTSKTYVFSLEAFDGFAFTTDTFAIKVEEVDSSLLSLINNIVWVTDEYLGEIDELEPSTFKVIASAVSGIDIEYVHIAGNLPPGLTLVSSNGQITGTVGLVTSTSTYSFKIRARSRFNNAIFTDRTFSIKVNDIISANSTYVLYLGGNIPNHYNFYILEPVTSSNFLYNNINIRYRIDDPNFSLVIPKPIIYLTGGLDDIPETEILSALGTDTVSSVGNLDTIWRVFDLKIGDVSYSKVTDVSGNPLYEVVYLELLDKDVSYSVSSSSKEIVTTSSNINYIPFSIKNLKNDLVIDWGYDKEEILPKWMTVPQSATSDIGYKPAIELMYVKSGYGEKIVNELKNIQPLYFPKGTKVTFSYLIIEKHTVSGISRTYFPLKNM